MTTNDMLELLILTQICDDYNNDSIYSYYLDKHYDMQKLGDRYDKLGKEFLNEYALNKTEKSEENL
jgi:hypothetical protein